MGLEATHRSKLTPAQNSNERWQADSGVALRLAAINPRNSEWKSLYTACSSKHGLFPYLPLIRVKNG